jgi:predicted transcriptional regulator of viral defense system
MREKPSAAVDVLRQLPSPLFTSADVAKLVAHDNVFLYRASRKGYVRRIANRIYWNVLFSEKSPTVEQVACFARQPSYVSCEWALNYHGILLQAPTACAAITLHPGIGRRNRIKYGDYIIEYSRVAEKLYLPDEILALDSVLMATPEKALLDSVYLRGRVPFADELETEILDRAKLGRVAAFYPGRVKRAVEAFCG